MKEYDKYVEIIDEPKEEYLIDLTSYIINNKEQYFKADDDINLFLHKMKIQIEQNFNINISIGKGNNALLASLACLKCFIEKSNKKSNQKINFNDTNYLFENENKYDFLISVENNENSIITFLNTFPLEYLANSENKYIENFNKLINIKDFIDIKTLGDIINTNSYEIYNIFNKDNLYKEIFYFCLGIGESFHKSQIIKNDGKNNNETVDVTFKDKNKSQLIKLYTQQADILFKQIFFYHYSPKTLVIILKTKTNKSFKRVIDKETLFDTYESLIDAGIKIISLICDNLTENEIKEFNKMTIFFDNIVKFDTIDRKIWEKLYEENINGIRIKTNKSCYWNNFLNSKSKEQQKVQSKSIDNKSSRKNNKEESEKKKKSNLTSKSIDNVNKFSKKANLDLLGFNKKRKKGKGSKYEKYILMSKTNKLENYGITSKEQNK